MIVPSKQSMPKINDIWGVHHSLGITLLLELVQKSHIL